jgi:hypothetical protein
VLVQVNAQYGCNCLKRKENYSSIRQDGAKLVPIQQAEQLKVHNDDIPSEAALQRVQVFLQHVFLANSHLIVCPFPEGWTPGYLRGSSSLCSDRDNDQGGLR